MPHHIIGAAMMYAFDLAPAKGEEVFDIHCRLGVMRQVLVRIPAQLVLGYAQGLGIEFPAFGTPVFIPVHRLLLAAEKLHLHLHELAAAEGKEARVDLVAEGLAGLRYAKGDFLAAGVSDRIEVDKDRLAGLGAQIGGVLLVKNRPHIGLHHQVELARLGHLARAAARAETGVLELVHAVALLASQAVGHQVGKLLDMAGGMPDPGMTDNGGVNAHYVVTLLDHVAPPKLLDAAAQWRAIGTIVPKTVDAAIYLGTLKNNAAALAQGNHLRHKIAIGLLGHLIPFR